MHARAFAASRVSSSTCPPRLGHESVDLAQPEPCSLAHFLRGEERLEHAGPHILGNSRSAIAHRDGNIAAWLKTRAGRHAPDRASDCAIEIMIFPPSGMASRALTTRFSRAASNCGTSTSTDRTLEASEMSK